VVVRVLALLLMLLLAGCAGTSEVALEGPPKDAGHGSVEEVGAVLEEQGVPCRDPQPVTPLPPGTEQAVECTLDAAGATVRLVHFFDVPGSQAYEAQAREQGGHGVYADTWAATTGSAEAAELIERALRSRASS
jgi:hypothetical protein